MLLSKSSDLDLIFFGSKVHYESEACEVLVEIDDGLVELLFGLE